VCLLTRRTRNWTGPLINGNKRDAVHSQAALGEGGVICRPISSTRPLSGTSLKVALPLASPHARWDLMFGAGHVGRELPWEGGQPSLG